MARQTRREFLKRTAITGGALALAPLASASAQAAAPADMCIARFKEVDTNSAEAVKNMAVKLTEQAIANIGGMARFVKKGDVVWVKPNIAWNRTPELAANTNPDVVATLIRLCLDAGAKTVKVGDNPCHKANESYAASGIEAAAKAAGAEIVYLDKTRFKEMPINGKRIEKWLVYPEIAEADFVLNVPVVKHHQLCKVTLCMKNYLGVVGEPRGQWHQDMETCLCDITAFMKPTMCVLDAVRIMTANGPTGGDLANVAFKNTIAAGTDIVALEAFGAELLGHNPAEVNIVTAGQAAGLGKSDYRALALKEVEVS